MARCLKADWSKRTCAAVAVGFLFLSSLSFARPNLEVKVCPSCEQSSIAAGVATVAPGGQVIVEAGTYKEHNIKIEKSLVLRANGRVIVDGDNAGSHVFHILSSGVKLSGFDIKNTGSSYIQELSGIRVTSSGKCEIVGNHFENTTYGIYLENAEDCLIRDNVFRGRAVDESSGGNGIHLWQGVNIVVENNDIQGHRDGIYFEFVKSAKVQNNVVSKSIRYGLHFMQSNDCEYENNIFVDNGAGVAVMYSRRILMRNNRFSDNRGVAAYGLLLKEIHESQIEKNRFSGNTVGLYMEGCNRNQFEHNQFHSNGWAIRVMGDCDNNRFTKNDIIANTFDVATNSENNPNEFVENYWSQYPGYDLNKDGVGDIPYRPVSLSSVIMENVDSSFVLIKSFLLIMLDEIERSLPELIPERMKDVRPLMSPQNGDL